MSKVNFNDGPSRELVAAEVTRRILPSNSFRLVTSAATAFAPIPESAHIPTAESGF